MLFIALLRMRELKELDLLELVLAQDSARVFSGCASLGAEAGGPRGYVDRQFLLGKCFVAIEVVEFHFAGGGQPEIGVLDFEEVRGKFRKLAGGKQGGTVDEKGRKDFRVAVLARVYVQEKIRQGTLKTRAPTLVHREASSGHFGSRREIQNPGALTNLPVGFRGKIELRRSPPSANLDVFLRAMADRDTRVRKIRNREKQGALR